MAEVSACLARAFVDDPVSAYLFPDLESRERRLRRYIRWQLSHVFLRKGLCWTTDTLAGAALWLPPRRVPPTFPEGLSGLFAAVRILGRQTPKAAKLMEQLEKRRPSGLHWYLGTIGTEPRCQRSGIGSALLSVSLAHVDGQQQPAYLESSKYENVPFYRAHGFEVIDELSLEPPRGPRLWLMWRDASPTPAP